MNHAQVALWTTLIVLGAVQGIPAQRFVPNYDESKVPPYKLPDPLLCADGTPVTTAQLWRTKRRGEILELFRKHMYGRSPAAPKQLRFRVLEQSDQALGGRAVRKQVRIFFGPGDKPALDLLLYIPKSKQPVPAFLGLNFWGNHAVHPDPAIRLPESWMRPGPGVVNNRASEKTRGGAASRWQVELILSRGYALATAYYGDIDPDYHDGFQNGVHGLLDPPGPRPPDAWGAIAAWAWGLSRALDYLEREPLVDARRVAVMGHSRLGKTALWAGAQDERFALVISNNSGCGGAALSRRRFGETVWRINTAFPHWFCENFKKYNNREDELPLDQHMLIALIAPRPCYVASAQEDRWADPRGEFLAVKHAVPVYRLLLGPGVFPTEKMPPVNRPVMGVLGYHIRTGKHDVTRYDWEQYLRFADRHLKRSP